MTHTETSESQHQSSKQDEINFFHKLVETLELNLEPGQDSKILLETILNAPKSESQGAYHVSKEDIEKAAKEVALKFVETLSFKSLERIANSLATITGDNILKNFLEELHQQTDLIIRMASEKSPISERPAWFIASLKDVLISEIKDKPKNASFQKELAILFFEATQDPPRNAEQFKAFAEDFTKSISESEKSKSLEAYINKLIVKADNDFDFSERLKKTAPLFGIIHSRLCAALCKDSPEATAEAAIRCLFNIDPSQARRTKRLEKASELLAKKLRQKDGAKHLARYAKLILRKSATAPHKALKLARFFESQPRVVISPAGNRSYQTSDSSNTSAARFGDTISSIQEATAKLAQQTVISISTILGIAALASKCREISAFQNSDKANNDRHTLNEGNGQKTIEHNDIESFKLRIIELIRSNNYNLDDEIARASSVKRQKEEEELYLLLKRLALEELVKALQVTAEAIGNQEKKSKARLEIHENEVKQKVEGTQRLLQVILHPSADEAIRSIWSQRDFIHPLELRPPSELTILDRTEATIAYGESKFSVDVEGTGGRIGLLRMPRRKKKLVA